MPHLYELISDAEILLSLPTEELARNLLTVVKSQLQSGMIHRNNLESRISGTGATAQYVIPWMSKKDEIELAVSEAWSWLIINGMLVPAAGLNGSSGFYVVSRLGKSVSDEAGFRSYARASAFPRSMLHPDIADQVWIDLARGRLDMAVFYAFRAVEEAVRRAGGYGPSKIGVELMREAFQPDRGPLTDLSQEKSEREALAHLFAGAIGSYKNPHSHRTVSLSDISEAQEMVVFASHLLRIVEDRQARRADGALASTP